MTSDKFKEIDIKKPSQPEDLIIKLPASNSSNFDLLSGKTIQNTESKSKEKLSETTDSSISEFNLEDSLKENGNELNLEIKKINVKEFNLKKGKKNEDN